MVYLAVWRIEISTPNLKHAIFNCYELFHYFHATRAWRHRPGVYKSMMALFKFFKRQVRPSKAGDSLLTRKEVESADVAKALGSVSKQTVRGKYNSYTAE